MSTTNLENKLSCLELRQQLAESVATNKQLYETCEAEKRDMLQDEESTFEQNAERAEELKLAIRQAEKREYLAKEEAELNKPIRRIVPEKTSYNPHRKSSFNGAFRAWLQGGRATPEDMRSADEWGINPHSTTMEIRTAYGLDETTTAAGAALVPTTLYNYIFEAMKAFGGLASKANVITTQSGNPLVLPNANFTSFAASASTSASTGNTFAPFGEKTMNGWLYRTNVIPISLSMIQDAAFDIQQYVGKILGMGLARGEAADFVNGAGSGSNECRGIVTDASVAVSNTAYSYNTLLNLVAALDPAYYPNATWLMSQTTYFALAALVDGNSRPLMFNQLQALPNSPFSSNLLGFPVQIDQAMPSTTGNTTIIFGDLSYFNVRRIQGSMQLVRYLETFRQTYNSIGLEAQERVDSILVGVGSNGPVVAFELLASS